MCQQRGGTADECRLSVELFVLQTVMGRVIVMITQTAVDDVNTSRVGQFGTHGPVILLDGLLRHLVFTAYQPVVCLGSRPRQHFRLIGSHSRQYPCAVICLMKELFVTVLGEWD